MGGSNTATTLAKPLRWLTAPKRTYQDHRQRKATRLRCSCSSDSTPSKHSSLSHLTPSQTSNHEQSKEVVHTNPPPPAHETTIYSNRNDHITIRWPRHSAEIDIDTNKPLPPPPSPSAVSQAKKTAKRTTELLREIDLLRAEYMRSISIWAVPADPLTEEVAALDLDDQVAYLRARVGNAWKALEESGLPLDDTRYYYHAGMRVPTESEDALEARSKKQGAEGGMSGK